jgi:hypothetical protein
MASLNGAVKVFIVERLACFDRPTEVQEAVKAAFKVNVSLQQLACYDPTKVNGRGLSKTLKEVFEGTRKKFLDDTSNIPIAHKSYRLRRLQKLADDHDRNPTMVLSVLEQAAKEQGEAYTNRQKHEHSGAGGQPLTVVVRKFGDERAGPAK